MTRQRARRLVALYPAAWRARYGAEFAIFLEDRPSSIGAILDVIAWALVEHVRNICGPVIEERQRSLILMTYASLAAFAAGINFYWTVDDTAFVEVMRSRWALLGSFHFVAAGSVLALLAVVVAAGRVLFQMLRGAAEQRRVAVLARATAPLAIGSVLLTWLFSAAVWSEHRWGAAWVPTPWDIGGDWIAPAGWPPAGTRMTLGAISCALLIVGLIMSGTFVAQAIRRTDLSRIGRLWLQGISFVLTVSVIAMSAGVAVWGWAAEHYAPEVFHARDGGVFYLTNVSSWALSAALFLVSATLALSGRRAAGRFA
jgi:hypothetical protein